MKALGAILLAVTVMVGVTGCGKSEQWQKNKADCIAYWNGYKSPEELDKKCSTDADYWEQHGRPADLGQ